MNDELAEKLHRTKRDYRERRHPNEQMADAEVGGQERLMEDMYPAVGLAYDFVQPSYDWLLSRIEATTARVQQTMAFAATVTFAAPVFITRFFPSIATDSPFLHSALGLFVAILGLGTWALASGGTVKLVSPGKLYNRHLHKTEWQFKKDMIWWAHEAALHNGGMADRRGNVAVGLASGLGLEVLCFVLWIIFS